MGLSLLSFSSLVLFSIQELFFTQTLQCKLHSQAPMLQVLLRKEKLILSWFLDLYKNKEQDSHPLLGFLEGHLIHPCHCPHQGPDQFIRLMDCCTSFQLCRTHLCSEKDKYLLGGHLGQGQVPFHPEVIQHIIQSNTKY